MRSNRKILFGVIILVAVFVLYGLYSALSNNASRMAAQPTPAPAILTSTSQGGSDKIAYAAVNLPAHSIITRDMLKMGPRGGLSTSTHITDLDSQAVGFVTRVAIPAGAAIEPANDFVGHITQVGVAGALQPGTRAMVIPIGNKPSLHDLVRIGNYVDVLAAFDGQEARTIVQGVRVLAVDIYGNDFPEKSVAMRGPFKTDAQGRDVTGAPAPASGNVPPADPNATPTPLPTQPPANTPRPDPSITLEVTPEQAARIQLAQAKNAPLDFVLLPALPGNVPEGPISNPNPSSLPGAEGEAPALVPVSVTSAQLAPYAERKKTASNNAVSKPLNTLAGALKDFGKAASRNTSTPIFPVATGAQDVSTPPATTFIPDAAPTAAPAPPATYNIPIYADGKVVRTETVLTPQE